MWRSSPYVRSSWETLVFVDDGLEVLHLPTQTFSYLILDLCILLFCQWKNHMSETTYSHDDHNPPPRTSEEPDAHFFDPVFLVCCTLTSVSAEMKKLMNLSSGFNFSPEAAQVGTFFCQQQQLFPPPHILMPTYKTCLDPSGWRLTFRFLSWWGQRIVRFLLLCF